MEEQAIAIKFVFVPVCSGIGKEYAVDRCVQIARSLTNESVLVNFGGDAHRYLLKDGVRYSHVLNPKTGWSVPGAPHTVSVTAPSCVEAGMMSTMAMLQGEQAEDFLKLQEVDFWLD